MSKRAGKFVIGLTGNIGTGKSVVRRMLEHLGAFGIDADALAHRAISKNSHGYHQVIEKFGSWMLDQHGRIDRTKLGGHVFSTPGALTLLESIIHPIVITAVDSLIKHAHQSVIVIEAIKLLEARIEKDCDSLWVTYATPDVQLDRLMKSRHMNEQAARLRISAQPPQEDKITVAQIIIYNLSTLEDTWQQVINAWNKDIPSDAKQDAICEKVIAENTAEHLILVLADPGQAVDIANLIERADPGKPETNQATIMQTLIQYLFLLLYTHGQIAGAVAWQPDNLVARINAIYLDQIVAVDDILPFFINNMNLIANKYQCEAVLVSLPQQCKKFLEFFTGAGYLPYQLGEIGNETWEEAVRESYFEPSNVYIKSSPSEPVIDNVG